MAYRLRSAGECMRVMRLELRVRSRYIPNASNYASLSHLLHEVSFQNCLHGAFMHSGPPQPLKPCCANWPQGRDYASGIAVCSSNCPQGVDPAAQTCVKGSSAAQTTVKGSSMQRKPTSGECIKRNLRAKCPQGRELLRELASRGRQFTPLRALRAAYSTP